MQTQITELEPQIKNQQNRVNNYYRQLPLSLSDGRDAILQKPTWIVGAGHPQPEAGLSNLIIHQLDRLNDYDVKYNILVPVGAIVGRCNDDWVKKVESASFTQGNNAHESNTETEKLYAPLLPLLIEIYGSSYPLSKIDYESLITSLKNKDEKLDETTLTAFTAKIKTDLNKYRNLEMWLRWAIDHCTQAKLPDNNQGSNQEKKLPKLIEPLVRTFGGVTRYEFSARGTWYNDQGQPIDDMLIVMEFCAKSSIMAKTFIEKTIVEYLCKVAGEDCVLIQEIPIHGFLKR